MRRAVHVATLLDVARPALRRTAPSGRDEDFHGVHLLFDATVPEGVEPRVAEVDGTTDAVAWAPVAELGTEAWPVLELVTHALAACGDRGGRP